MKKIYGLMALAMGVATLFSCSDDDNKSTVATGVQVTSAESTIKAAGGAASIEVDQNVASAYAADSWLKLDIDGNKVSATADRNNSRESRFTTVVIKASENDSTIVSVAQLGTVFGYTDGNIKCDNEGTKAQRYVLHNAEVHVAESPDWITAETKGDSVYVDVAKNTTGNMRKGLVCLESGNYRDTLTVTQASFDEGIAGDYQMYAYYYSIDSSSGQITDLQLVSMPASIYKFGKSCTVSLPDLMNSSFEAKFNGDDLSLEFANAQQVATYSYYPIYQVVLFEANGSMSFSASTEEKASFSFDIDDLFKNGTMTKYAELGGQINGYDAMGLAYLLSQSKPLGSKYSVLYLFSGNLLVEDNESEAKVFEREKARLTPSKKATLIRKAQASLFAKHLNGDFKGEF